jgi:ABC-type glycerol-3-phosphate transport system substrate-binding protein
VLGLPKRTLIVIAVLVGVVVLYVMGSEQPAQDVNSATPAASATDCKVTVTADVLNVRAAPDVKSQIVGKFQRNSQVDAEKTVQNGFRKLSEGRWVSDDFVKAMPGRDC